VANTQSAEKRNRQSQKRRARNQHVMSSLRSQVRKLREAVAKGDAAKTKEELVAAVKAISKAASKGVIHKAQASRRISRLTRSASAPAPAQKQ
jgi:small subunit ribosomal protein S20